MSGKSIQFLYVIVHGYSIKLNEESIRQGASEAIDAFYGFVDHIRTKFDIPFEFSAQSPYNRVGQG